MTEFVFCSIQRNKLIIQGWASGRNTLQSVSFLKDADHIGLLEEVFGSGKWKMGSDPTLLYVEIYTTNSMTKKNPKHCAIIFWVFFKCTLYLVADVLQGRVSRFAPLPSSSGSSV